MRVLIIGAGIGASMAMESASVLAEEIARIGVDHIPAALGFYEARRKRRCEAAQRASRFLARVMFVRNPALAALRRVALRFARPQDAIGAIVRMAREPI